MTTSQAATTPHTAQTLAGKTVVLIGGGSGIGLETARMAVAAGAEVVLGGRRADRLETAAAELGEAASWHTVDTSEEPSIEAFFDRIEVVDALFTSAATYRTGSLRDLSVEEAASPFESKFWGQYRVVKAAVGKLSDTASIVLMSGAASVRPSGSAPAYVAANAAIEGLARGLAVELAPIRVNAVSPGTIDGNLWGQREPGVREPAFAQYSADAVLGRPGRESEVAGAVLHLFSNTFTTGSTLYVDGGYALR